YGCLVPMVGAGGIAGSGPDAAVVPPMQLPGRDRLVRGVSPDPSADIFVHFLPEGLGEAIAQYLGHNRPEIVARGLERARHRIEADAGRDGEEAYPVFDWVPIARPSRGRQVIGEAEMGAAVLLDALLAEEGD